MESLERGPLEIILELSDNKGYVVKELAKKLDKPASSISADLAELTDRSIIYGEQDRAKMRARGLSRTRDFYYIGPKAVASPEEKLAVFQLILKSLVEPKPDMKKKLLPKEQTLMQEKLLKSEYVNFIIETCGLIPFYNTIEEYMGREDFLKMASRELLGKPALINEYIKFPALIKEQINANSINNLPVSDYIKYLEFLYRLDEVNSIRFYRKYLAGPLAKVYTDASDDILKTLEPCEFVTDGIKKFLEPDIFLSPFTSFPFNRPVRLLLEKPFERLYNSFYIYDEHDIKQFVLRAHIIYKNFVDIVLSGMIREYIHLCDVEIFLNQYILSWNRAVSIIDGLYHHLIGLDFSPNESESPLPIYHVYLDISGFQIMDLNANRLILDSITGRILISDMSSRDNPWKEIYPCNCFAKLGLETENKSYEKILSDINYTLKEKFK